MSNPKKHKPYCVCGCGQNVLRPNGKFFSNKCQAELAFREYIQQWKCGKVSGMKAIGVVTEAVRRYLIEKYGAKCSRCGWAEKNPVTGKVPITVDHIDGNYMNNHEENLRLLCPNCHSLTETYGGLNRGHGRRKRINTYRNIKLLL